MVTLKVGDNWERILVVIIRGHHVMWSTMTDVTLKDMGNETIEVIWRKREDDSDKASKPKPRSYCTGDSMCIEFFHFITVTS